MRRHLILLTAGAFVLALPIVLMMVSPPLAAAACPQCYGLAAIGENIYAERSPSAEDAARALMVIHQARERLEQFYEEVNANPRILVCFSEDCYQSIGGGGSSGMAILDIVLFLSPKGVNPVIAAHELSHIELHRRLGALKTFQRSVPQWFDEGLAVLISDDLRYLAPPAAQERCLVDSSEPLPRDRASWIIHAGAERLYAKAGCRVWKWTQMSGGPKSIEGLVDRLSHGAEFEKLVFGRDEPG